ncbi:MAG TPA: hypothetical protein VFN40_12685 [Gemmatimonadales bacterium]|nr:hypothetical protein [Gemmatimonadales bacterium]
MTAGDPAPTLPAPPLDEAAARAAWQQKLLPLMAIVLTSVSAIFLILSLLQTNRVRSQIENGPTLDLPAEVRTVSCLGPTLAAADQQACVRWKVLVQLEAYTVANRYHQANSALIVRASIKYLGFLTGMILAIVGAVFILGKLTEAPSNLAAEASGWKVSIASASPGLILAVLGTALIIVTVLINPPTGVTDLPTYLDVRGAFTPGQPAQ